MLIHIIVTILNIALANPKTEHDVAKLSFLPNGIILIIRIVLFFALPNFYAYMKNNSGGMVLLFYIIQAIVAIVIVWFFLNRKYRNGLNNKDENVFRNSKNI
jgi:uncharacterized membrane protein